MLEVLVVWILVGLAAQLVDGTLGMAYGVTSTTALTAIGIGPALASASVHTSEIFTTLVSGTSHFRLGNVRKDMILHLAIPGVIGGIMGALTAVFLATTRELQLIVGCILLFMGVLIFVRFALKSNLKFKQERPKWTAPLGWIAAYLDALGGGGWGPIATSTLVTNKMEPSKAIGSVNFTEFFVTLAETITFMVFLGLEQFDWLIIAGLIVGGLAMAPLAAYACKKIPTKVLGVAVGAIVIIQSIRYVLKYFRFI